MKNKRLACMTLAAVLAACALSGCGSSSKSGGGKTGSDGAKLVTIWSPTDEPAIEEWWVEKINASMKNTREKSSLRGKLSCGRIPMLTRIKSMRP